jgi:hypothetical protein
VCHYYGGVGAKNWLPLLGYTPELLSLPRGWSGFVFKTPEDTEHVLNTFGVSMGGV